MAVFFILLFCGVALGFMFAPEDSRAFGAILGGMIVFWCTMLYVGGHFIVKYW